jgi:hypothetical protein
MMMPATEKANRGGRITANAVDSASDHRKTCLRFGAFGPILRLAVAIRREYLSESPRILTSKRKKVPFFKKISV